MWNFPSISPLGYGKKDDECLEKNRYRNVWTTNTKKKKIGKFAEMQENNEISEEEQEKRENPENSLSGVQEISGKK